MGARNATNLVMLVMAGMLVLLVWLEPGSQDGEGPPRLLAIDPATIERIRVTRLGQEPLLLERVAGRWWLREPFNLPANGYRVTSLLRLPESRSLGQHPVGDRELTPFGLAPPQALVTLNDETVVAFGHATPLDNRRYLLLGDQFHLVTDSLYYQLITDATRFIDLQLLPEGSEPTALTLPALTLQQTAQRWQVSPEPTDYSADQAVALVDSWRHAQAVAVERYDGNKGKAITIELAGGERYAFLVTAESPELIVARPELGIQYHLAGSSAARLLSLLPPTASAEETPPVLNGVGAAQPD